MLNNTVYTARISGSLCHWVATSC